jgi:uncharacterized protein (DUF433 family)
VTTIQGVIHGKTIELQDEPGLPDGQPVAVTIQRIERISAERRPDHVAAVESWMDHLVFDASVLPGERIVKGTRLAAEDLVAELQLGRTDDEIQRAHPELSMSDVEALRHYAQAPIGPRRSFGAWAEDAEELDRYLEWTREQRKAKRREIDD